MVPIHFYEECSLWYLCNTSGTIMHFGNAFQFQRFRLYNYRLFDSLSTPIHFITIQPVMVDSRISAVPRSYLRVPWRSRLDGRLQRNRNCTALCPWQPLVRRRTYWCQAREEDRNWNGPSLWVSKWWSLLTHYGLVTPYCCIGLGHSIGSGNGSLSDGTKPLPEPTLTYLL